MKLEKLLESQDCPSGIELSNEDLVRLVRKYKGLLKERERDEAFWVATNENLRIAYERLDGREKELAAARAELEKRVEERTAELAKANEKLRMEITDRKQAEEALAEREAWLRAVLDNVQAGIVIIDADTREIVEANPAALAMMERSRAEVVGTTSHDLFCPVEKGSCPILDLNRPSDFSERVLLTASGESVPILKAVVAVRIGERRLVLESFLDISERKRAEELRKYAEQLRQANIRFQEADQFKSGFLATMSHELRTPLNSIIGFTGILLQRVAGPLNDEQIKQLNMVRGSSRHLLNLINDVLDISKIEAGQLKVTPKPFDMRQAIEKAVETVTPLAEKKGLSLVAEVAPEVGEVVSDGRRVEQVLINLLNNAVKFTQKGEVRVECEVDDDRLVTRVVDTGIGIKPEDMDKLFRAFSQIDAGSARRYEGTGLGLSICKRLVEMLGGEIRVESEWGKGSIFAFTVPMQTGGTT